ncbi:DUF6090 family protein [Cellulophaga tyrosinoxydans]|uniref:Uncharacterized protein n=1 Tax=Cellulophaga tyrosinoxydans TaxID=504486 RepID=A0A1W2CRR4_9FLAO|nr:DUF6090 family protein [Cellulophaga tyrosinoxydans]SMC87935.1 hypothetical protein SAMN05660703_3176 [Cellulophaga tyrosinoxydans]
MIKFFRHIRQRLLSENKFSKYILYAIGEIVLVIIGILIALQINNKNEQRKTENKIVSILKEVQHDLGLDIQKSDELIAYYKTQDSIINLIQTDKLTYDDYKNDNQYVLRYTIMNAFHMKIHANGYTNFIENVDNVPKKLKAVIEPLNEIYIYNKYEIDKFDKRLDLITDRVIDELAKSKDWYYRLGRPQLEDEMIDFFLNDRYYKNNVNLYQNAGCENLASYHVMQFRENAINAYKQINTLVESNEPLPDFIPHNLVHLTTAQLNEYEGTYKVVKVEGFDQFPDWNYKIQIQDNDLIGVMNGDLENIDFFYFETTDKIFGQTDIYFKGEFIRDSSNEITSLIIMKFGTRLHLNKLETN